MLWLGWSRNFLWFPIPPISLSSRWRLFQTHQLQLVSPFPTWFVLFFSSLAMSKYQLIFSLSFIFILWSAKTTKSTMNGLLAEICWSVCISKSQRILCLSFSWTDSGVCIYNMVVWSNFNLLHNSERITFPTQLYLVLYFFSAFAYYMINGFISVSTLLLSLLLFSH